MAIATFQAQRLQRTTIFVAGTMSALLLAGITPANAGEFSVTPVRIYMAPKDRAVAVTITNDGNEELVMQADLFLWKQKPGGEDDLTPTEDLFLSPPIIKMAPKSRQVVRLARLSNAAPTEQLTYRMIVREIPEAKMPKADLQLQIALAFSMPVFITPTGAKGKMECSLERTSPNTVKASCENSGAGYLYPTAFLVTNIVGDKLVGHDTGGYILPGIKRSFELKRADGKIPGGKAKLVTTLDDGTTQTYDVTVAD